MKLQSAELASRLKKTASEVIKQLMKLGVMASVSQFIDFDTASLVAMEFGAEVEREVIVTIEDRLIDRTEDTEEQLVPRSPVVVVRGMLITARPAWLDAIRKTNVAAARPAVLRSISALIASKSAIVILRLSTRPAMLPLRKCGLAAHRLRMSLS